MKKFLNILGYSTITATAIFMVWLFWKVLFGVSEITLTEPIRWLALGEFIINIYGLGFAGYLYINFLRKEKR